MLTNLRDVFIGQSRSPNIVPFHMRVTDRHPASQSASHVAVAITLNAQASSLKIQKQKRDLLGEVTEH